MANINASLKNLVREMHKTAINKQKITKKAVKVAVKAGGKGWCGRHSELPTDINWAKVPRGGYFDKCKRDRGNNRQLMAAMAAATKI